MAAAGSAALAPGAIPAKALFGKLSPGPGKSPSEVADHQRARIHSAVIELVAERGYDGVTLRELARVSGVSSRAFYNHYANKEECFLRTHELIVRRIVRHILAAQVQTPVWDDRLRVTVRAFLEQLARDSRAARLILVEADAAGPAAREQMRWADLVFGARFKSCFDREPSDAEMSPVLIEAIVAGLLSVARSRLVAGRADELPSLAGELTRWAMALVPSSTADGVARPLVPAGDRALLDAAMAEAVASDAGGADEPDA